MYSSLFSWSEVRSKFPPKLYTFRPKYVEYNTTKSQDIRRMLDVELILAKECTDSAECQQILFEDDLQCEANLTSPSL